MLLKCSVPFIVSGIGSIEEAEVDNSFARNQQKSVRYFRYGF